ncbi:MAG: 50S ribosomal protein L4 [Candidatus Thermoplasmatota archaeon]|jgi:large subunit ribosomal protein L4e|nr:50S ribosomal protein L4 [Candidatus Thermoplasmatota archaeon]MCL5963007.1 50S ribosomal protein L4 [Candidatus Thermoplasmatota archaeon]
MSVNKVKKANVYSIEGTEKGSMEVPAIFLSNIRSDIINKIVKVMESNARVPYGADKLAGMKHSVEWAGKGRGVARTPRLMDSLTGAQAPNTVGGREAHPPKSEKNYKRKINKKEMKIGFTSALSASADIDKIRARGHIMEKELTLPIVVEEAIESVNSTKEAKKILLALGLWNDVLKSKKRKKERAGKGKIRGRRLKRRRGILVVVSSGSRALGFNNLDGVEVKSIKEINVSDLAPGGMPGRLTIYSKNAMSVITEVRPL